MNENFFNSLSSKQSSSDAEIKKVRMDLSEKLNDINEIIAPLDIKVTQNKKDLLRLMAIEPNGERMYNSLD